MNSVDCDSSTLGVESGQTKLEAQWQANTIDITWYDGDTQLSLIENDPAAQCTYDGALTVPSNAMSRSGYTFDGWKVRAAAESSFTITTTNMTANDTFKFSISASGDFTVDCGDGGELSGTGVSGNTITRSDTTRAQYTCTYPEAGSHDIVIGGRATGYNSTNGTNSSYAAVGFSTKNYANNTPTKIASVSGSLGAIFPTLNDGSNDLSKQPRFASTFYQCTNLTSISSGLFSGVFGAADSIFNTTFYQCTGLTSLPSNLFGGISGAASYMFNGTFSNCSGLTSLPSGLFNGISGAAQNMFSSTFSNCSGLTSLPSGLFDGISGAADYMFNSTFKSCTGLEGLPSGLFTGVASGNYLFSATFEGCTGLKSLPSGLFAGISRGMTNMFATTFKNCTGLKSLPSGLFAGISSTTSGANSLFSGTFNGCSSLETLPSDLFGGVYVAAKNMFMSTFYGCSSLRSLPSGLFNGVSGSAEFLFNGTFYGCSELITVPYDLFAGASGTIQRYMFSNTFYNDTKLNTFVLADGTTVNYVPDGFFGTISGSAQYDMNNVFYGNTAIASSCPANMTQAYTAYASQWNGRVACKAN